MFDVTSGALLCLASMGATDDIAANTAARFREVAPALASVHFVARSESPNGGSADWESDLLGVFVSADGLVLVPGSIKPEKRVRTTLVSITVTTTEGTTFDAAFVSKDADLGIAFVHVRESHSDGFPFVRFDADGDLDVGDPAIAFAILPESLERARRCELVRVAAALTRPRRIFLVNESLADNLGSPVVRLDGVVVGVVATPRLLRSAASAPLGEDGGASNLAPPCILPSAAIAKRIADLPRDDTSAPRP
ncbi:MAG: trypsin-like peptidase domain-containing protein, partial [Planctomycetes bacterium]|nr:trypsin-like peptidase domain-containing protein [Planctomycetota bacterium]